MMNRNWKLCAALCVLTSASWARADATLSLEYAAPGPFSVGDLIHVNLRMEDIPLASPAAGFQAFLEYDTERLQFVRGTYTSDPFPLHIIVPITAVNGTIDLAAGINFLIGQQPTTNDSDLATLTFELLTNCGNGTVSFRAHEPPTNLSTLAGSPILPLQLVDLPAPIVCAPDVTGDNLIGVADLLAIISDWGPCPPSPPCCSSDVDSNGLVGVSDLLAVISAWGACP